MIVFAKQRHRPREEMYEHQGDKAGVGWDELGDWD